MSPYRGMPIAVLDQVDFFVTIDTKYIQTCIDIKTNYHFIAPYKKLYDSITTSNIYFVKTNVYLKSIFHDNIRQKKF